MSDSFKPNSLERKNAKKLTLNKTPAKPSNPSNGNAQSRGAVENADCKKTDTLEIGLEFKLDLRSEDLVVLKELGAGNGGTVSKVMHAITEVVMARKVIRVDAKDNVRKQILRELQVGQDCSSPYVITYYGAFQNDARDIVLCMEYMDCGISKDFGPVRVNVLGKITESILGGLVYLYEAHRIMHRDIKPSNVLVNSRGMIKLCDFGVATETVNSVADTFVGTSTYMAPERIRGGAYSVTSDVWSVGLTVMELAVGRFPFDTNDSTAGDRASAGPMGILDLLQTIVHEPAPKLPQSEAFPVILHDFVAKCLLKDPEERPTPRQLYDNDLFLQAAKRTPVDLEEWAVSMMNRDNRKSYLAPPAPRTLKRDGSRDSVISHLPTYQSMHDHTSFNNSANGNAASTGPNSGSSADTQSTRTISTPTSTSGDIPVIATQSPPLHYPPTVIPPRSPTPPLSLEHLSLETQDKGKSSSYTSRSNRLGFTNRDDIPEPASAVEPLSRPMFPSRMHSASAISTSTVHPASAISTSTVHPASAISTSTVHPARNGLQSATMPRRGVPPPTGPPTGPLPLPPGKEVMSAGFGSPRRQR